MGKNYGLSCLVHTTSLYFGPQVYSNHLILRSLDLPAIKLKKICRFGALFAFVNRTELWPVVVPTSTAKMASAVVCCCSFNYEPLPLLSQVLTVPAAFYLIWVSSTANQTPDFFSPLPISEAGLENYLRVKIESGSQWALLCGWCSQALSWGMYE